MAVSTAAAPKGLQFVPFSSGLDAAFWHKMSTLKLEVYGLDDKPRDITGYYCNGDSMGLPARLNLDFTAFEENAQISTRSFPAPGTLKLTNTMDDFRSCDKAKILSDCGDQLWADVTSGRAIQTPQLLARFVLLTFADLKKYHYYYWFAFPALCAPEKVTIVKDATPIEEKFSQSQLSSLVESFDSAILPTQSGFFLAVEEGSTLSAKPLSHFTDSHQHGSKIYLCVCDPSTLDHHPGWPLRNLLALAAYHWSSKLGETVEVLCFRDRFREGKRSVAHSIMFSVALPSVADIQKCPKCVGWEKNEKQKLGPRMVNLSASMDPARLAESAVDLNLKLMRWRLLPSLDLDKIKQTRCLLLGAGTLGCNVSRCLLGWGVRKITLVDSGKISYSNPVRQSLFTFDDSLQGGRPKAQAAAESLKKIFPGVDAVGVVLSIPMPGHAVAESTLDQTRREVEQLEKLVDEHDVIFLLMDTRESRWLPTLLGACKQKIVMNAALGFDTFLVVRHGLKRTPESMDTSDRPTATSSLSYTNIPGDELGCYFCNDVVAPGDSTRDRTLDQQCTVSRPGMSMIAAALAVELLVSVLVHPDGGYATGDTSAKDEHLTKDADSPLGLVPHQIRGFLSRFHHLLPASRAFDKCTACSQCVMDQYREDGFQFLLNAFNQPSYLEDLTGLTKLHQDTHEAEVWELSEDDDDDM